MPPGSRPTRRELLGWSTLSGLCLAAFGQELGAATIAPPETASGFALDPAASRALDAATARILPSGDGPGAREAHVLRFLDAQLAGSLAALRPALIATARVLDQVAAQRQAGKAFAELDEAAQDRLLSELSRGELPLTAFPQREVFQLLHTLTLEGFLADPIHGGNFEHVAWRALGFAAPHRHGGTP